MTGFVYKDPKAEAGRRVVDLGEDLERFVGEEPESLLFSGEKGGEVRKVVSYKAWHEALAKAKVDGVAFHDLRHTDATEYAQQGATAVELMARHGHSSPSAVLIYQHAVCERQRALVDAMD